MNPKQNLFYRFIIEHYWFTLSIVAMLSVILYFKFNIFLVLGYILLYGLVYIIADGELNQVENKFFISILLYSSLVILGYKFYDYTPINKTVQVYKDVPFIYESLKNDKIRIYVYKDNQSLFDFTTDKLDTIKKDKITVIEKLKNYRWLHVPHTEYELKD
jgi:hypothetical protein